VGTTGFGWHGHTVDGPDFVVFMLFGVFTLLTTQSLCMAYMALQNTNTVIFLQCSGLDTSLLNMCTALGGGPLGRRSLVLSLASCGMSSL